MRMPLLIQLSDYNSRKESGMKKTLYAPPAWSLLISLTLAGAAHAQTSDTWNGGNGYWDVASNWSGSLPGSTNDAENDTSGTITFRSGMALVNSFLNTLSGGFDLTGGTLSTTKTFKNSGNATISLSAGTLNVGTDFVNTGSGAINVS